MTHLYYGDISPKFSDNLAITLFNSGADMLEIGIPYSDPVSDGPVFQKACRQALERGITPLDVLKGIKKIREKTDKPIYLTSYFGPIFKLGAEKFCNLAKDAGINGLIIPDFPIEEQVNFPKTNLPIIQFATVYSDKKRLKKIIHKSAEFIYFIGLAGVTGDRVEFIKLRKFIKFIKSITDKTVYCGFGIRTPDDAKKIIKMGADGVIVGSAIAEFYQDSSNLEQTFKKIEELVRNIKKVLE